MYKLKIIAGPRKGSSFTMAEGENAIGRQSGNAVVLPSAKVSKRHCVLVVSNGEVVVRDEGSSNGTFVNGVFTKARRVGAGDRISVGEYVFEIVKRKAQAGAVVPMGDNVFQLPAASGDGAAAAALPAAADLGLPGSGLAEDSFSSAQEPTELKGKALWKFERHVMPIFYGLNFKYEWRMICLVLFALFTLGSLILSVHPLVKASRDTIVRETGRRARFMARQIAERNAPFLAAKTETKAEIGSIENAEGVRVAVLVDLESRIIAPASKLNQYLTGGPEAVYAVKARDQFRNGRENGMGSEVDESTVVAVEPVRILSQQQGRNVTVAMAVVSIDTSIAAPDAGEIGVVYSEAMILTGLLAALVLLVLYRLTVKPFQVLSDDLDKVLKGEMPAVTQEFKFAEMAPLWDLVNSAVQRLPKGGGSASSGGSQQDASVLVDDAAGPLRMVGNVARFGLVLFDQDRKISYLNSMFEEISGIRYESAVGQEIGSVARDQSMGAFVTDLFDRAMIGSEGVSEDYEFSGITHKVYVAAFGSPGSAAKAYLLVAARGEG